MSEFNGGPAFPYSGVHKGEKENHIVDSHGMTLREYFAAKAMAAYISTAGAPCIVGGLDGAEDELARQSYKMADAMLRARGQ
ncbi:hypothetical protein [Pantoea stewartii]|uniref:hypothetical protein n=1 Tax=Pantoea stewartii TaxID=66269 RepID=UPI000906EAFF|nr:hypothetical protein [Pantoea stewartii]KAB0545531.1 hypothetical protein F7Q90_24435 [Pantoea stewartii subsp. stewartii]